MIKSFGLSSNYAVAVAILVASLVLGGGTQHNLLSDGILELIGIPALAFAVLRSARTGLLREHWLAVGFIVAVALVPLLQLVPWPIEMWGKLPGRTAIKTVQTFMGQSPSSMPLSVAPDDTVQSALNLIVPAAVFLCGLQLNYHERRWLALVLVGGGVMSAVLGLLQLAQGPSSVLRFYAITNVNDAVGFFANRNHFSALLYVTWSLAAVFFVYTANAYFSATSKARSRARIALPPAVFFIVVIVLLVTQLVSRSRAGLVLAVAAVGPVLFGLALERSSHVRTRTSRVVMLAIGVILLFMSQYAVAGLFERLGTDPMQDARLTLGRRTYEAAMTFLPFGAGVGTFIPGYSLFEQPQDTVLDIFANHAHNDWLEIMVECGVFGAALLILFVAWLIWRGKVIWSRGLQGGADLDRRLAGAAAIAVPLLLLHSFIDYPLRTMTLMAVLAFCCVLMSAPAIAVLDDEGARLLDIKATRRSRRSKSKTSSKGSGGADVQGSKQPEPPKPQRAPAGPKHGGKWGEDVEWPEQWRKPAGRDDKPGT